MRQVDAIRLGRQFEVRAVGIEAPRPPSGRDREVGLVRAEEHALAKAPVAGPVDHGDGVLAQWVGADDAGDLPRLNAGDQRPLLMASSFIGSFLFFCPGSCLSRHARRLRSPGREDGAVHATQRLRVAQPKMMRCRIQAMIGRRIDGPAPQDVARERGARLDPQDALFHSVVRLDRLRLRDAGMRSELKINDSGPLLIGREQFTLRRFPVSSFALVMRVSTKSPNRPRSRS